MQEISTVIRERILADSGNYFANDNIAKYIKPGDLDLLIDEVTEKMEVVLKALVINTEDDHNTQDTARRVSKMWISEVFRGRYINKPEIRYFPNAKKVNSMYVTGPITVRSCCSHHLVPFIGTAYVGVVPGDEVVGLSKFNRLIDWVFSRPQIQEEALIEIADTLEHELRPKGLGVVVTAQHHCMTWRGVKDKSVFTNSELRGCMYNDPAAREEFMALINMNMEYKQ